MLIFRHRTLESSNLPVRLSEKVLVQVRHELSKIIWLAVGPSREACFNNGYKWSLDYSGTWCRERIRVGHPHISRGPGNCLQGSWVWLFHSIPPITFPPLCKDLGFMVRGMRSLWELSPLPPRLSRIPSVQKVQQAVKSWKEHRFWWASPCFTICGQLTFIKL